MRLLTSCLFVFTIFSSFAQETYLGVKMGSVMSQMKGDSETQADLKSIYSGTAGLVICSQFDNVPFGFSLEPGYVQKGGTPTSDTIAYKLHYLNMPVLFDYYPTRLVKLSAGVEPAFLLRAANTYLNENITDNYEQVEISATVGVSLSLVYFLDINFRYSMGLNHISDYDPNIQMRNISNNYTQVSLIWKIAN